MEGFVVFIDFVVDCFGYVWVRCIGIFVGVEFYLVGFGWLEFRCVCVELDDVW